MTAVMHYLRCGNLMPAAPVLVIMILALQAPSRLQESPPPAPHSVVSLASGRELVEGSRLSRGVLRPIFQPTPSVILSQHHAGGSPSTFAGQRFQAQLRTSRLPLIIGQNDDTDENEVSTDEIEKYVSVYKAMQRNRTLTINQAAAAQGLTVEQFRQLENRIQRDDAALQQARDELQAAAQSSPTPSKSP